MTTVPYNEPSTPAASAPRVNVRLLVFLLVVSAPFLYIIGKSIRFSMTGGISDYGDYKKVDLKALGNFPFDQMDGTIEQVPQRYRELDGQRVMLEGFMFAPENAGSRGNRFQFVYDVNKCCFGGAPQVQERVFAYAKKGSPIYPQDVLATVVGTLHVRVVKDPQTGAITSVFDLDVEEAREAS